MNTYTDLKNKLKETINVDYRDRVTTQEVKFYNEANEYYGKFKGTIEIKDSELCNVTIYNPTLCGEIKGAGLDIPIDEIEKTLKQLDEAINGAGGKFDRFEDDLTKINEKIAEANTLVVEVSGNIVASAAASCDSIIEQLDECSSSITSDVIAISAALSTEIEDREKADLELKVQIAGEKQRAETAELKLSNDIITAKDELNERCSLIEEDLAEHEVECTEQIEKTRDDLIEHVAIDKHYKLFSNNELKYPYHAADFHVNVLDMKIKDASAYYGADEVAVISNEDDGMITIQFLDDLKGAVIAAVSPNEKFEHLKKNVRAPEPTSKGYSVTWTGDTIELGWDSPDELAVYVKDRTKSQIGKIKNYLKDEDGHLISGNITIESPFDDLKKFDIFNSISFERKTPGSIDITSTDKSVGIRFSNDVDYPITLRENIHDRYYYQIEEQDSTTPMATIYVDSVKRDQALNVSSFIVNIDKGNEVPLNADPSCKWLNEYESDGKAMVLCCDSSEWQLHKYEKHAYYRYEFAEEGRASNDPRGYVIFNKENVKIADYEKQDSLCVHFNDVKIGISNYNLLDGNFLLKKKEGPLDDNLWECEIPPSMFSEEDDECRIQFNGFNVSIVGKIAGTKLSGLYDVDRTKESINNADNAFIQKAVSKKIDWTKDSDYKEDYAEPTYACYAEKAPVVEKPPYRLSVKPGDDGIVKVRIPSEILSREGKETRAAREFMLAVNVKGAEDRIVELQLVNNEGKKASYRYADDDSNEIKIKLNKQYFFQVNEYSKDNFLVADVEDNYERDSISALTSDVSVINETLSEHALSILSLDLDIKDINSRLKQGLFYQGMIDTEKSPDTFINLLSTHYKAQSGGTKSDNEVLSIGLSAGYFWIINSSSDGLSIDNVKVGGGDRIYINKDILLSDVTSALIDVEDVYDRDTVHINQLSDTSCTLTSQIYKASCDLSTQLFNVSTDICSFMHDELSSDLSTLSGELKTISSSICSFMRDELSNDLSTLSNELCQTSCSICLSVASVSSAVALSTEAISAFMRDTLSADLYKLSGEVSATSSYLSIQLTSQLCTASCELTSDDKYLSGVIDIISNLYNGTLPYCEEKVGDNGCKLSTLLQGNAKIGESKILHKGDMFKLSAAQKQVWDDEISTYLGSDDFLIANKNVDVSSVSWKDIDIFRNAQTETEKLSTELTTQLNNVSTDICSFMEKELSADLSTLSGELCETSCSICLSVASISSAVALSVNAICSFMKDELSNDLSTLSNELNTASCSLTSQLSSVSTDISTFMREKLSNDLSTLSDGIQKISAEYSADVKVLSDFYAETFVSNEIPYDGGTTSSYNLIVVNEGGKDPIKEEDLTKYRLTFKYGSLALIKIGEEE